MFISEASSNTDPTEMEWASTVAADINPDPDPEVIRTLLRAVRDSSHDSGIPRDKLYQHGEEQGFSEAMVNAAIEELRVQGRIYEAIDGHLRSTE
jgi:DNA replicative helicase MCM subunit Mcm2 (Cdc46/Mcm family)